MIVTRTMETLYGRRAFLQDTASVLKRHFFSYQPDYPTT